jgi:hypothetical protein
LDAVNYIVHFVKHRLKAHSLNDIHSPFVFDLAEKVLKSNEEFYVFKAIELERKKLLHLLKPFLCKTLERAQKHWHLTNEWLKTLLKPA